MYSFKLKFSITLFTYFLLNLITVSFAFVCDFCRFNKSKLHKVKCEIKLFFFIVVHFRFRMCFFQNFQPKSYVSCCFEKGFGAGKGGVASLSDEARSE